MFYKQGVIWMGALMNFVSPRYLSSMEDGTVFLKNKQTNKKKKKKEEEEGPLPLNESGRIYRQTFSTGDSSGICLIALKPICQFPLRGNQALAPDMAPLF